MIIYLAGGYLTDAHVNYLWSYMYMVDPKHRFSGVADLYRFLERKGYQGRKKNGRKEKVVVGNRISGQHPSRKYSSK